MKIPISLYIHIPWCKKKCPYCDFNSHTRSKLTREEEEKYVKKLIEDFEEKSNYLYGREVSSVFIGGGTPSLPSASIYKTLFTEITKKAAIADDAEITIEINPGTLTKDKAKDYREAGINRVSIGAQSTQNDKLKAIQRIHSAKEVDLAVTICKKAGFKNINIDLMFGLPGQSIGDMISDLRAVVKLMPTHISWYQLTLEPGTHLYKNPPILPIDGKVWNAQEIGRSFLQDVGFNQYEISAFAKDQNKCSHNLNYWEFGDYIGIGAGAHGKITLLDNRVYRYHNVKNPKRYLSEKLNMSNSITGISGKNLLTEFMMNSLRLFDGINIETFEERTGLSKDILKKSLETSVKNGLIHFTEDRIFLTKVSRNYLNDILSFF